MPPGGVEDLGGVPREGQRGLERLDRVDVVAVVAECDVRADESGCRDGERESRRQVHLGVLEPDLQVVVAGVDAHGDELRADLAPVAMSLDSSVSAGASPRSSPQWTIAGAAARIDDDARAAVAEVDDSGVRNRCGHPDGFAEEAAAARGGMPANALV